MTTLAGLHAELNEMQRWGISDAAYWDKQIHALPDAPVIDRIPYIVARCQGLRVLNLGSASGTLNAEIKASAVSVIGVDHEQGPQTDVWLDFDDYEALQAWQVPTVDLIVFAETSEHLLLPGAVLRKLRSVKAPLLVTTPNAHAQAGQEWVKRGYENIHKEHTHWHSVHTLKVMLERTGWTPEAWSYYGGQPRTAEGLICLAR